MTSSRAMRSIRTLARFATLAGGCIAASIVLSGCLASVSGSHDEIDGPVTITSVHCFPARGESIDVTEAACLAPEIREGSTQYLLAYRIDDVLEAPSIISTVAGEVLTFRRSDQYSGELNTGAPAGAGARWVGYIADVVSTTTIAGIRVSPKFTLRVAPGHDAPATVDTIVTLGKRAIDGEQILAPVAAGDPVVCTPSAAMTSGEGAAATAMCSSDDLAVGLSKAALAVTHADVGAKAARAVAPGGLASYNALAQVTTTLFGAKVVPGAAVDVVAGTTAATPFEIVGRAPLGRTQDVDVQVETTIPGAAATASRSSVTFSNVVIDPVTASISVPATTPAGTYTATLHLVSRGFTLRSATTTIRVVDAPAQAPVAGGGAAADPQSAAFVTTPKLVRVDRTPPHFKSISWPKRMTRAQLRRHGIAIQVVQTERAHVVEALAHFETENGRKLTRVGMTTIRKEDGRVIKFKFRPTYAGWKVLGATGGIKLRITFRLTDKAGHTWTVKRPVMLF